MNKNNLPQPMEGPGPMERSDASRGEATSNVSMIASELAGTVTTELSDGRRGLVSPT